MGRTLPSVMQVFDSELARWNRFRRALRREDQDVFDELFLEARRHVASMAYQSNPYPLESILLAIMIEERRAVKALAEELRELRKRLEDACNRMAS